MQSSSVPETISKYTGKYKVIAELGQGGMANVYLAVARGPSGFNKLVVLKSLRTDISVDPDFMTMFLEEARLAARLNHPHVVQTYEVGEYASRPVIVMEYLEGQTLANVDLRAKARLSLALRLRVLIETLEGLHHAHELTDFSGKPLGIVHRDVSPQNVFITFDGHVKVLDFGIAKVVNSQVQTATGILKGKVRYMAPEQMLGSLELDRRADIYAVGVMLWESMVGRRMWQDHSDMQIMTAVTSGALPRPRDVKPELSTTVEEICMKALAPNPEERFATALEMASALEGELERLGTPAPNRQLGQLLRDLFEDVRARTRATIEAQLIDASSSDESGPQAIPSNLINISTRISEESPAAGLVDDRIEKTLRSRKLVAISGFALAGVVAAAAVALSVGGHAKQPARRAETTAAGSAASSPPPTTSQANTAAPTAPAPTSVQVNLSTIPADAILFLDGRQLPTNPFSATLPVDSVRHIVRGEARGYATRTVIVSPDHDTDVILALDPLRAERGLPPRGVAPPPTHAVASASVPGAGLVAKSNCTPPYFIDADGIKRFKPECVGQ